MGYNALIDKAFSRNLGAWYDRYDSRHGVGHHALFPGVVIRPAQATPGHFRRHRRGNHTAADQLAGPQAVQHLGQRQTSGTERGVYKALPHRHRQG